MSGNSAGRGEGVGGESGASAQCTVCKGEHPTHTRCAAKNVARNSNPACVASGLLLRTSFLVFVQEICSPLHIGEQGRCAAEKAHTARQTKDSMQWNTRTGMMRSKK